MSILFEVYLGFNPLVKSVLFKIKCTSIGIERILNKMWSLLRKDIHFDSNKMKSYSICYVNNLQYILF